MHCRYFRPLIAALALAVVTPGLAAAQRVIFAEPASRGWLGIAYQQEMLHGDAGTRPVARITSVEPGSPAEQAGIAVGDTILTVNDIAASQALLASLSHSLSPGESVQLRVRRGGAERDVTIVTAERPAGHAAPQTYTVDMDAIRGRARIFLDSALVQLDSIRLPTVIFEMPEGRAGGFTPEQLRSFGGNFRIDTIAPGRIRIEAFGGDWPRGEELDSIVRGMTRIEVDRMPFGFGFDSIGGRFMVMRGDTILRAELDSVADRLSRTYRITVPDDSGRAIYRTFGPGRRDGASFEGVTFFAMRALAGAELADVDPAMESYFGTREGVLVLRVGRDTPAAAAGLQAGDIILGANDTAVNNSAELRRLVAGLDTTTPIRLEVLRERRAVRLELTRE